jgi:isopenicillin-N N-acyltransferase-like protein
MTKAKSGRLKIVEVSGTHENMGKRLGSACKREARSMLSEAKGYLERESIPWERALRNVSKYVPFAEEYDSDQMSFIRGHAKGSGLTFEETLILFCLDEKGLCTDVMVNGDATEDGKVYSAHTEDWTVRSQEHVVLVKAKPRNRPSVLVMTHAGLEWISGVNSAGISVTANSLYQNDTRVGVPKLMIAFKVLASKTIGEALSAAAPAQRASSFNNNICHSSGEMYCVEGSATDFATLYPENGYLVHTNHYLHQSMQKYEDLFGKPGARTLTGASGTIIRFNRATKLVREQLGAVTVDSLIGIMRDHVNRPSSICAHPQRGEPEHSRWKTTYAVVIDVKGKGMHVCVGNPCEGEFKLYGL